MVAGRTVDAGRGRLCWPARVETRSESGCTLGRCPPLEGAQGCIGARCEVGAMQGAAVGLTAPPLRCQPPAARMSRMRRGALEPATLMHLPLQTFKDQQPHSGSSSRCSLAGPAPTACGSGSHVGTATRACTLPPPSSTRTTQPPLSSCDAGAGVARPGRRCGRAWECCKGGEGEHRRKERGMGLTGCGRDGCARARRTGQWLWLGDASGWAAAG